MGKRLAIIPARGGSKRIPGKNIKPFLGKPMIGYTLEAVVNADIFDEIHVSTDSAEVCAVAKAYGLAPAFPRPEGLADDRTPLIPVLKAVVEEYARRGQAFDSVTMVMACAPLIEPEDLRLAVHLFEEHGGGRDVIAVAPYPVPVEWAYKRDDSGVLVPREPGAFAFRSQDLPVHYFDAGAFLVASSQRILEAEGAGDDTNWLGMPLPSHRVVDIDNQDDWCRAEAMAAALRASVDIASAAAAAPWRALRGLKRLGVTIPLGPNAHLRALRVNDVTEDYVSGLNDPKVKAFVLSGQPHTHESCVAYVEKQEKAVDAILFGLFVDGRFSATLRLHDVALDGSSCYMGLAVFRPTLWGQGWGTRMVAAATEIALDILGVDHVCAGVTRDNSASARVFTKAGFSRVPAGSRPWDEFQRTVE